MPAIIFVVAALALIVTLIEFLCSPRRPKEPVAAVEGVSVVETEGSTPPSPQPRSHLFY